MNCTDRSSPIYRKFVDFTGIRKDFTGIRKDFTAFGKCSESVRKGFIMFYVHSGCSESLRNILCILEVYEQFVKCSERIHEGFWLIVIHSAA